MAITLFGVMRGKILAQTLALKSFYDPENSATLLNALSEEGTMLNHSKRKFDLRLSLEHFNQPLLVSNTSPTNGNEIVMMNDYLECHSQESWILPLQMEDLKDLMDDYES